MVTKGTALKISLVALLLIIPVGIYIQTQQQDRTIDLLVDSDVDLDAYGLVDVQKVILTEDNNGDLELVFEDSRGQTYIDNGMEVRDQAQESPPSQVTYEVEFENQLSDQKMEDLNFGEISFIRIDNMDPQSNDGINSCYFVYDDTGCTVVY